MLLSLRLAVCQRTAKRSRSGVKRITTQRTKEGETRKLKGCKIVLHVSLPQRETLSDGGTQARLSSDGAA